MNAIRFTAWIVFAFLFSALIPRASLYAHHSIAGDHDTTKTLYVTGIIKQTELENPHSLMRIDANGKEWIAILPSPSRLNVLGLRTKLLAGVSVKVVGYPHRQQNEIYAQSLTIDGKTIEFFPL